MGNSVDNYYVVPTLSNPMLQRKICSHEWGDPANPRVVVCVHGLSRNGRDFDKLAESLSTKYRVLCPDMAGRGNSDWLANKDEYTYLTYASDIITMLMQKNITQVDWIGTSMGGIIGMMVAAQHPMLVRRIVINDIGSIVSAEGLKRILSYVGMQKSFATAEEAMKSLRFYLAPFGVSEEADWQFLFSISFVALPDGGYRFNYDPDITKPFRQAALVGGEIVDVDLSALWLGVQCPALLLRGEESDILSASTARAMLQRLQPTKLVEFPKVGHAPALLAREQIQVITEWLA